MPIRIDLLDRYQRRMMDIVGMALPLIASRQSDADMIGLKYLRREMIETLASYDRLIHEMTKAAVARCDDREQLRVYELREHCSSMRETYDAFHTHWVERQVLENWAEYRLSAIVTMKRIRNDVVASRELDASFADRPA